MATITGGDTVYETLVSLGVDGFRTAFAEAMKATGPVLLDIDMDSLSPMLVWGSPRKPAASE